MNCEKNSTSIVLSGVNCVKVLSDVNCEKARELHRRGTCVSVTSSGNTLTLPLIVNADE
jgi:hypothetical protein